MLRTWPASKPVLPRPEGRKSGNRGRGTVKLIGTFKLVKGILLLGLALGGVGFVKGGFQTTLRNFVEQLSVDPGSKYFQEIAIKLAHFSPRLPLIVAGTICYSLLFCLEGIGLLLQKRWAEYLTAIVTGSFLPLELYELLKHRTPLKGIVIALNLAIFVYLIVRLKKHRNHES